MRNLSGIYTQIIPDSVYSISTNYSLFAQQQSKNSPACKILESSSSERTQQSIDRGQFEHSTSLDYFPGHLCPLYWVGKSSIFFQLTRWFNILSINKESLNFRRLTKDLSSKSCIFKSSLKLIEKFNREVVQGIHIFYWEDPAMNQMKDSGDFFCNL